MFNQNCYLSRWRSWYQRTKVAYLIGNPKRSRLPIFIKTHTPIIWLSYIQNDTSAPRTSS
ncbi:hypothetical protein NOVOSPHI9U_630008 [Novosphingobium sp. 9U]|nr:hypothetical protein NOVOSPHI9U_630008 [Novosphingobium sp. 9U]